VKTQKKAELLVAKITSKDLNAIAAQFGVEVDTMRNVNFGMNFLPGLGNETKLIGRVSVMEVGEVSEPIIGQSGVFVAELVNRTDAGSTADLSSFRNQISMSARGSVNSRLMEVVRAESKIKDNRYTFY